MTNMKANKKLGIYIDYTSAYLMELINKNIISRTIEFESVDNNADTNPDNLDEKDFSKKQHHLQSAYFIEISDIISNYNQVILFGPSESKTELFNLLEFNHDFDHIRIQNVNTDEMTPDQSHDFVKEYFKQAK